MATNTQKLPSKREYNQATQPNSLDIRLEREELPPEYRNKARDELRETPEQVEISIQQLKQLIEEDDTLKVPVNHEFLIKFLRPTKFYPESAYQLIRKSIEFRQSYPDLLHNLTPKDEEDAINTTPTINILANRDAEGRRIMVLYPGAGWDPSQLSSDQIFRIFYLIHQAAMLEPKTQVSGVVVIIDLQGLSLKNIRALSPAFAYRLLSFCQDSMPLRLKEIHIIRQPFIFNMIWQLFKPFLRDKLRKRIFFHGYKLSSLHNHIDTDHLPSDFDGNLPAINYSGRDWYPVLSAVQSYVKEWNECEVTKKRD